ncbi:MAG: RNA methyltransferase [Sandaracinaceae bacterium]|nr:MAG: RNA methyltransferase [Sandaracinaceae bacterium]
MTGTPLSSDLLEASCARLLAERRFRDQTGLAVADGVGFVRRARDAGLVVEGLLFCPALCRGPMARRLVRATTAPVVRLSRERMTALSARASPDGLIGVVRQRWRPLPRDGSLFLVAERLRSMGNLGTLLRTARATGVDGLVLMGDAVDPYDPAVVRASMGAVFTLPMHRASPSAFARWARDVTVIGASAEGVRDFRAEPFEGRCALAVGEERRGLQRSLRTACDRMVRIPMCDGLDSLNVAVAGSLLLYEAFRRRAPPEVVDPAPRRRRPAVEVP